MNKFELWYPVKNPFVISQKFGENPEFYQREYDMKSHNGWDIVGVVGQIIRASHDGIVTFTGEDGRGGLGVVVRSEEKYWYEPIQEWVYFKTVYWHCLPGSFAVKPGDKVKIGTALAKCDSTGFTGNSHLHFGLKPVLKGEQDWEWYNLEQNNGWFGSIDPEPFFNKYYAEDAQLVLSILSKIKELLLKVVSLLKLNIK